MSHVSFFLYFNFTVLRQCANIGPADYNYDETISTLRYANRAKNIKNRVRVNEDPKDALLRKFQTEIETLRRQLEDREASNGCFVITVRSTIF